MLQPLLLGASMAGLSEAPLVPLSAGYYQVIIRGAEDSRFSLVGHNNGMTGMDIHDGGKVYIAEDCVGRVEVLERGKEVEISIYLRKVAK